ncbi:MAG TPA: ATP-binding protein, partial [Prolixibacteraceae bacterium]|nr:ATP-binding protein [Prolixibacteraceae bacterium]
DNFKELAFNQKLLPNTTLFHEIQKIDLISSEGILVVVKDITQNYKENVLLNKKLNQYASIFEYSPLGIAILNQKREVVMCNKLYNQTFKKQQSEMLNTKLDNHVKTEHINKLISSIDELLSGLKNEADDIYAVPAHYSSEDDFFIRSYFAKYADEYGDVSYVIQIVNDVTDDIVKLGNDVEKEQYKLLKNLAYNYAEKMHRHLSVIQSGISSVSTNSEDKSEVSTFSNILKSLSVVNFENSKLRAFKQPSPIMRCEIDLFSIIDEIVENTLNTHNINIQRLFSTEKRSVLANPIHMRIVFQNILNNAIEASSGDGSIKIDTKIVYFDLQTTIDDIELEKGKYLRVVISDEGEGITKENYKKICKPFFTTREPWNHVGLGLTIARQLVVSYDGEILIKPNHKKGTTVSVYLPVVEDDVANTLPKPDEFHMSGLNANILMVNNEDVVRNVMAGLLKQLGYNIIAFKNISNALQFYRNNMSGIEIVLLDENLKEEDNYDVLISSFKGMNSDVNIVLLKANDSLTIEDEKLNYIRKPVSMEKLNNVLTQILGR